MCIYIHTFVYVCFGMSGVRLHGGGARDLTPLMPMPQVPATWKHGWSKHGSRRVHQIHIWIEGIILEPCWLRPCFFHVASSSRLGRCTPQSCGGNPSFAKRYRRNELIDKTCQAFVSPQGCALLPHLGNLLLKSVLQKSMLLHLLRCLVCFTTHGSFPIGFVSNWAQF